MNNTVRAAVAAVVADMRTAKAAESAEASPEVRAAYAAGFSKAAEALGASPRALARRAAVRSAMEKDAQQEQQERRLPQQAANNFPALGGTRAISNHYLENIGQAATLGEGAALGAALGSQRANRLLSRLRLRGFRGKGIGALAGLSAGMLANMVGKGKAVVTKGRTAQDQINHDVGLNLRNLLPGVAAYNAGKRNERTLLSRWHG